MRWVDTTVNGTATQVSAFAPAGVDRTVRLDVRSGDVSQLGEHDVAVQADEAKAKGYKLGDTVPVFFPETGVQPLKVAAVYGAKEPLGDFAISIKAFDANVTSHVDNIVFVTNAPGVSMTQTRNSMERTLAEYPTASLHTRNEFKGSVANEIDKILNLVYVLLAMALVIALFGIANTLALSVFERTREFGLLRAVGMSRKQVRSTVRWESVLIALLGTTLGVAIGLAFAWAMVKASAGQGINQMSVPTQESTVLLACAAVAAVLAAALPARRAARLNVLEAISQ